MRTVQNWSDRGEFCCTAFVQGLSKSSAKLKVNINWQFGQSEHGKNEVDGKGHVIKTTLRGNISEGNLKCSPDEEHVMTARDFCIKHFNEPRNEIHRNFFAVLDEIDHKKSSEVVKTLDGIMSFHSFSFNQTSNTTHYRHFSCNCHHCYAGNKSDCDGKYVAGAEYEHAFKKPSPKQT